MTRYLLDSGIATDYIDRRNGVYDRARAETQKGNRIGTGMPIVAELVSGIERSRSRDRNFAALRVALPTWKLRPFDEEAAFEYGRLHALLVRAGRPMQVIDIMIAAIALTVGNTVVVTAESDLSAVPGLTVENWVLQPSP